MPSPFGTIFICIWTIQRFSMGTNSQFTYFVAIISFLGCKLFGIDVKWFNFRHVLTAWLQTWSGIAVFLHFILQWYRTHTVFIYFILWILQNDYRLHYSIYFNVIRLYVMIFAFMVWLFVWMNLYYIYIECCISIDSLQWVKNKRFYRAQRNVVLCFSFALLQ